MHIHVIYKTNFISEWHVTYFTSERLVTRMHTHVIHKTRFIWEQLVTYFTREGLFVQYEYACVKEYHSSARRTCYIKAQAKRFVFSYGYSCVSQDYTWIRMSCSMFRKVNCSVLVCISMCLIICDFCVKDLSHIAHEKRPVSRMGIHVSRKMGPMCEGLVAYFTSVLPFSSMDTHVFNKIRVMWEWLVTYFTSERHVSCMDSHVCRKIRLMWECLTTYSTGEMRVSCMDTHVCVEIRFP